MFLYPQLYARYLSAKETPRGVLLVGTLSFPLQRPSLTPLFLVLPLITLSPFSFHPLTLSGPPGTGKTHWARTLAQITQASFFYANAAQFDELFLGRGAQRIRRLFDEAIQVPILILIRTPFLSSS